MTRTLQGTIGAIGMALLVVTGCAPDVGQNATCPGGPIRVGAVATITGVIDLHSVPDATRAVIEDANAAGGVGGCSIEYIVEDDGGNPQNAAQIARDLVDNRGVEVLAGSASLVDCQANAPFYERKGIVSLTGMGAEPACFRARNILPLNVGPYALTEAMLTYAADVQGDERMCAFFVNFGGTAGAAYRQTVTAWERDHRRALHLIDASLPMQTDHTPYIIRARDAGCQTVVANFTESLAVQWVRAADRQRIKGIRWFLLAPVYTENVRRAIETTTQKVFVFTEWKPADGPSQPPDAAWQRLMVKKGLPMNQRTQAGFAAGSVLVKSLRELRTAPTRAAIAAAVRGLVARNGSLDPTAVPMRAIQAVTMSNGAWQVLPGDPVTPVRPPAR